MAWLRIFINGTLWSIAGVLVTVAIFYWQEQRGAADLAISLEDEVNLIEVREAVPELQILYQNEDLLTAKRGIKLARIKIQNRGETILQSHFDQTIPFGISFPKSRVLDATVEETNSEYLRNSLLNTKKNSEGRSSDGADFLALNPIIFERNKFALLKIYLLQEVAGPVGMRATGKIANIEALQISKEVRSDPASGVHWIEPKTEDVR
jgi:hypothetical protein